MDFQQRVFRDYQLEARLFSGRALFAALVLTLILLLLFGNLFRLQVLEYDKYRTESRDNRVKLRPLPPTRGQIYDRNGVALAINRLSYQLEITPVRTKSLGDTIERLSRIITITDNDRERFQQIKRQRRRFDNIPIRTDLDETELASFAVNSYRFPEVVINAVPAREYPLNAMAAHVVGYVARISEKDLEQINVSDYSGTTHIGKTGLEQSYEALLHGSVGVQREEVNAAGRPMRVLERDPPISGRDLHLHLDTRIQEVATAALGEFNGAVVAIEVETGGVIAMVSKPSFDPNPFVEGIPSTTYKALLESPNRPLYHRAIKGQYPPASTVKPFIAWAGLFSNSISYGESKSCPGYLQLPGQEHRYRCWKKFGHGTVSMEGAITASCDVYFYELALEMGIDKLNQYLAPFGFGAKTGIDLQGERSGILPSQEWKRQTYKKPWYAGETVIAGIGQGYFIATPLQLATATATLAANGVRREPRLVDYVLNTDKGNERLPVKQNSFHFDMDRGGARERVVHAMTQVVESPNGTAKGIRNSNYHIAGKTGTAQVFGIKQDERYRKQGLEKHLRDHGLFVAFAPADRPRIAVAIVAENGESGGHSAAPIAKRVMDAYLLGPQFDEMDEGEAPQDQPRDAPQDQPRGGD
jgi:penicillin-binding protein 2